MTWLGVPFKFLSDSTDSLNLAVRSLPDLVLKSDTDYTSAVITGIVSLVAGLIPAAIAFYTFRKNAKIIKDERIAQQIFLKTEREEQQIFLKKERDAQAESMEKDRVTQKEIAERNFNKEVLSVNRQAWINTLREQLSEYLALMPELLLAKYNYLVYLDSYSKASSKSQDRYLPPSERDKAREELLEVGPKLKESLGVFSDKREKNRLLTANIKLMLNPLEDWYPQIVAVFCFVDISFNSLDSLDQDEFRQKNVLMLDKRDELVSCAQKLLKYEWERVKKGE